MLPRPRLGDHPRFAEASRQEDLSHGIIDLVGAGVAEVLPLQVDPGAAEPLAQATGEVEGRGASHVLAERERQLLLKLRILSGAAS